MKKIKYTYIALLGCLLLLVSSCETTELDLTESPNQLSPDGANPTFVLNQVQLDLVSFFSNVSDETMRITRQVNQFDSYASNIDNATLNGTWTFAYRINNNRLFLDDLAQTNQDIVKQSGVADLMTAYTFATLTDITGDIIFSQANNPLEFPNPELDDDEAVYNAVFELIDSAIMKLSSSAPNNITEDLFYNGDISSWLRMANTLKLKMFNQIRVFDPAVATAGINDILASPNGIIEDPSQDFQFNYTTAGSPIESRHRFFTDPYLGGGASVVLYMNNYYMALLKDNDDPRLRYYFYRQSLTDPTGDDLPCSDTEPLFDCYIDNFYWGRNHANSDGVPADNLARTIYGIYPGGGAFDPHPNAVAVGDPTVFPGINNTGLGGEGIDPILLSSFTNFYLAETSLTLGTAGNTRDFLETAVTQSITKVTAFGTGTNAPTATDISDFIQSVLTSYDAAASDEERLEIILTQFHIAAYGNGIESYNFYRKTGLPNFQDPVNQTQFPRTFILPTDETQTNPNIDSNFLTDQVFWDTNPPGFIN